MSSSLMYLLEFHFGGFANRNRAGQDVPLFGSTELSEILLDRVEGNRLERRR